MKTYQEMIKYTVDQVDAGILRYHEWTAYILLAHAYGVDQDAVNSDIKAEKELRGANKKAMRKAELRDSHEKRRIENLAKKKLEDKK